MGNGGQDPIPSVEELDRLPTTELRTRAFHRAEERHDLGFFWDLLRHLPPSSGIAAEDASAGHIGASLTDLLQLTHELIGDDLSDLGDLEPLIRARFIDYLRS